MFCENCGKEISDNATFCEHCGSAVESVQKKPGLDADQKKKLAIIAGAAAVVLILLAIFGAFKPGAIKAAKKLAKGYEKGNVRAIWNVEVSPYDSEWEIDKGEKTNALVDMKTAYANMKKKSGATWSVESVERTKNYKRKEVKKIANYLEDTYDYEIEEYRLQDVQIVEVVFALTIEDKETTESMEWVMIKVKGKWYMDDHLSNMGKDGIEEKILEADED